MSALLRMANSAAIAEGRERDIDIDAFCQSLWDRDSGDVSLMVEIGNELHEKPAPFSDDLGAAMALAVRLLDCGAIDIEVAHRSVGGHSFARAEICGPYIDASMQAKTPALALVAATLKAVAARSKDRSEP